MKKSILIILIIALIISIIIIVPSNFTIRDNGIRNVRNSSAKNVQDNSVGSVIKGKEIKEVNIPFSFRFLKSHALGPSDIEKCYGKPNIIREVRGYTYEIRNVDDGSKLYVIYNMESNRVHDIWRMKKLFTRDDFKSIKVGQSTTSDVLKIDKYSVNDDLVTEDVISEHRLVNGEVLIIYYVIKNSTLVVNKMEYITNDPSRFTSIILPKDLQ